MLKRQDENKPSGRTITEMIRLGAQRFCIVFASSAVTFGVFDLLHVRTVADASALVSSGDFDLASLPHRLRTEIGQIEMTPKNLQAGLQSGDVAVAKLPPALPRPAETSQAELSPVAKLAAAGLRDAVDFAMAPPAPVTASAPALATPPAVASVLQAVQIASIGGAALLSSGKMPLAEQAMAMAIPPDRVPLPRAAPGLPPPSPAQRLNLSGKERARAERCLANAIYFEARSEPLRGQMAVAQVVLNRAFSGFYPNDICGVVYQNASRHLACQFTFACDGKRKLINEHSAWARANQIARQTLDGQVYLPEVGKSTHYHATYVHPYWTREMKKLVRYGIHNFYRPYAWGNGAGEPVWGSAAMADAKKK